MTDSEPREHSPSKPQPRRGAAQARLLAGRRDTRRLGLPPQGSDGLWGVVHSSGDQGWALRRTVERNQQSHGHLTTKPRVAKGTKLDLTTLLPHKEQPWEEASADSSKPEALHTSRTDLAEALRGT